MLRVRARGGRRGAPVASARCAPPGDPRRGCPRAHGRQRQRPVSAGWCNATGRGSLHVETAPTLLCVRGSTPGEPGRPLLDERGDAFPTVLGGEQVEEQALLQGV